VKSNVTVRSPAARRRTGHCFIDFVRWEYSSATIGAGVATLRLHRPDGSMLDLLLRAEQEREIALRLAEAHAGDLIALFRSRGWIPDDHS
jgi:hypothetical protein